MTGFDDFLNDLQDQLLRAAEADTARAKRAGGSTEKPAHTPWWHVRPHLRTDLAWAAAIVVILLVAGGAALSSSRSDQDPAASGLVTRPSASTSPYAYVHPVVPATAAPSTAEAAESGYSLSAVAARSATDAWAVGVRVASGAGAHGGRFSTILRWDGLVWRETPCPDIGPLAGVTVAPNGQAWALASSGTQSLHWDGSAWRAVPSVPNGANLAAVAALSDGSVVGVGGGSTGPCAVRWSGTSWEPIVLPPAPSGGGRLTDVAGMAPDDVWAVGVDADASHALTLHWDGTAWSYVADTGVSATGLTTVAVAGPDDVWAGGDALLQHWDGSVWTDSAQPAPLVRGDLSAASPADVWLPDGPSGVARFDGSAWQRTTTEAMGLAPGGAATIVAVGAVAGNDVWAVGSLGGPSDRDTLPLILHWDGSAWTTVVDEVKAQ